MTAWQAINNTCMVLVNHSESQHDDTDGELQKLVVNGGRKIRKIQTKMPEGERLKTCHDYIASPEYMRYELIVPSG